MHGGGNGCGELVVAFWETLTNLKWFDNPRRESTYKENKHPRSPDKIGGSSGDNFQDSSLPYVWDTGREHVGGHSTNSPAPQASRRKTPLSPKFVKGAFQNG